MEKRRKILLISSMGGLILIGLVLVSSLKEGHRLLDQQKASELNQKLHFNGQTSPSSQSILSPPSQMIPLKIVSLKEFQIELQKRQYKIVLIYVLSSDCTSCGQDTPTLIKMKSFYEPYHIGIEFLDLDPNASQESHQIFLKHLGFNNQITLFTTTEDNKTFLKALHPQAQPQFPSFIILGKKEKPLDYWEGSIPARSIDQRLRSFF